MELSKIINECSWSCPDENGKTPKSIPTFKKAFSKNVKVLWDMLENPENKSDKDLLNSLDMLEGWINSLKHDIREYQLYT